MCAAGGVLASCSAVGTGAGWLHHAWVGEGHPHVEPEIDPNEKKSQNDWAWSSSVEVVVNLRPGEHDGRENQHMSQHPYGTSYERCTLSYNHICRELR